MTPTQEAAMRQALEALEFLSLDFFMLDPISPGREAGNKAITALRAALAEPVQEQDIEDAIEAAYWHFDARKKGLNEWASAPQSERDAFKAEARKLAKGYFPTRQAQDTKREMLAVADAFIRGKRAALADGDQLSPGEPVQEPEQFDHGIGDDRFKVARGAYWWHVLIGDGTKKYGKFHTQSGAEEMAALLLREFKNGAFVQHRAALAEPVQEPTAKDSLQVEQAIAETATTQQQVEQTPPSEYRRGYWDGFNIGKREGRIEAEDALAEPVQEWASIPGTNVRVPIRRKG